MFARSLSLFALMILPAAGLLTTASAIVPVDVKTSSPIRPVRPVEVGLNATGHRCPGREDCLQVSARGFLAGELVRVARYRRPGWQRLVRADRHGAVGYRLDTVPGRDVLTFVGLGTPAVVPQPVGQASAVTVSVTVPRIAVYPFGR